MKSTPPLERGGIRATERSPFVTCSAALPLDSSMLDWPSDVTIRRWISVGRLSSHDL